MADVIYWVVMHCLRWVWIQFIEWFSHMFCFSQLIASTKSFWHRYQTASETWRPTDSRTCSHEMSARTHYNSWPEQTNCLNELLVNIRDIWNVTPCSLIARYRHFRPLFYPECGRWRRNIQNYNLACGFVWVRNLVSDTKGGTYRVWQTNLFGPR
jgi:hypothetical protein